MKKLLALAQFIQKKPTDSTIRILRVVLPAITAILLILASHGINYGIEAKTGEYSQFIPYGITALLAIPAIVFGVMGICGFKKGTMKKLQILGGLAIITLSIVIETNPDTRGIIPVWILETWLVVYGLYTLIMGMMGKLVTESCLKYGEIIKKIRV